MHHIYHTSGVILGSVPIGESNRFYKIFTEELGLVHATAQAVREAKSKLRYSLQDFSWASFDLVKGRDVWRITSALGAEHGTRNTEHGIGNAEHGILFARVCALVSRLVHGEGRNAALFKELFELALFLEREHDLSRHKASCEALASLRVLAHLGYFNTGGYQEFMGQGIWSRDILEVFESVRSAAVHDINRAMKETHL